MTVPEAPAPEPVAPPPYGYLPYEPVPLPPPPVPPRRRRVWLALLAAWALVLLGTGIWYSWHGRPSWRDQTTIASARPTVDLAITEVVRAAGTSAVPAISGFEKVADCDVTPARGGATYHRIVWLYAAVGAEPALLDRIAAGLPHGYGARAQHSTGGAVHTLAADAGNYVTLTGILTVPGLVTITADTGCRPVGQAPPVDPSAAPPANPLGITGTWRAHALPCGLRTVEVTGPAARPLTSLPSAQAVVSSADAYADRAGVAAHTDAGAVTMSVTTGTCDS